MKSIFILLICAVSLIACRRNNAVEPNVAVHEINTDSLQAKADTIEEDTAEAAPPLAVDELFADFIYSYSCNRNFQYGRTRFPLKRFFSGKETRSLSRSDWKFDRLYYKTELHIIISDSEKSINDIDSVKSDKVALELLKFDKSSVKQYVFGKEQGKWELTRLDYFPISMHPDSDFLEFYGHFANDSAFQRKHVSDYVDFITYDEYNENEKIEGVIDVEQWYAFHPELPSGNVFNINYGCKLNNADVRVISIRGNSNSWTSMFKFRRKDGIWKLVKFTN